MSILDKIFPGRVARREAAAWKDLYNKQRQLTEEKRQEIRELQNKVIKLSTAAVVARVRDENEGSASLAKRALDTIRNTPAKPVPKPVVPVTKRSPYHSPFADVDTEDYAARRRRDEQDSASSDSSTSLSLMLAASVYDSPSPAPAPSYSCPAPSPSYDSGSSYSSSYSSSDSGSSYSSSDSGSSYSSCDSGSSW